MKRWLFLAVIVLAGLTAGAWVRLPAQEKPAAKLDFERDVQPVLARCVQCHGPDKARAGLRLDSRAGALRELDSGERAMVPGDPERSELLRRVACAEDARGRMPPRGPMLSAAQVAMLRAWISAGADWPEHWAYRPLTKPAPPAAQGDWARTPIDAFLLARLRERGLTPAPAAAKHTLLRRLTFDLTGLPPTLAELDAFLSDSSPDAYEKVVERLLASPHHGERMARFWMDLVHFAETHGHDQDRPRDHAWPYRDYLIRAFNDDKPYARFVQEQVAGDVLFPDDPGAVTATGFLAAGPWDESSLRDIREGSIDREIGRYLDRDDVVTNVASTFISTTVHCARCHDHKFDPVAQADYFALQAVFAGVDKANRPYDTNPQVAARRRLLTTRKAQLAKAPTGVDSSLLADLQAEVAAWEKTVTAGDDHWQVLELLDGKSTAGAMLTRQTDGSILAEGKRGEQDVYTFSAHTELPAVTGVRLEVLPDDRLPHRGPGRQDNGNFHLNEFIAQAAPRDEPTKTGPVAIRGGRADFEQQGWTIAHALDGNPATAWAIYPKVGEPHYAIFMVKEPIRHARGTRLTFELRQTHGGGHLIGRLRLAVTGKADLQQPFALPPTLAAVLKVASADRTDLQRSELARHYVRQKVEQELAALPKPQLVYCGTPTFAPDNSFTPAGGPRPVHILKRGDVRAPGALAQPGALACVAGLPSRFDAADEGQRRAALARWLTDSRNGLTWRSIANRVWQLHFGQGLVETPNDFGRMGAAPSHRELLDWLAVSLQESNGSLKHLHRLIVTSAAYQQACQHRADHAALDADNRLLWRMNRRRLDAEAIHDAVLMMSGKLDATMGGPSARQFLMKPGIHVTPNVDYANFEADHPANFRRSVYRFLFRTLPDPLMEALDCPDGSQLTPTRSASVTALQALAMRNDKFLVRQAEHIAARLTGDPEQQVQTLYRLTFSRPPTAAEAKAVTAYATRHGLANACRVLINSNEFMFVD